MIIKVIKDAYKDNSMYSDISYLIGKTFEVVNQYPEAVSIIDPRNKSEINIFNKEYEIIEGDNNDEIN